MKIVVVGGTGLIGSRLVAWLGSREHEAVPASPRTGVDTITGRGLTDALTGASVVVDVSNSPSFEADAVLEFFETSTSNLLAAEAETGVGHHVALSVVGTDRLLASGYFRGKMAQETMVLGSSIPHSIVRATQFFEFVAGIAEAAADGDVIRVAPAMIQPIAADDVTEAVGSVAIGPPAMGVLEVAGPERFRLDTLLRRHLDAAGDGRQILVDPDARYFGAALEEDTLVPGEGARIGPTSYRDWTSRS